MKTFNFDVDDCFDSACNSLSKEMGSCRNADLDLSNKVQLNNNRKKKKMSLYEKLEIVCLLILVKYFL
ncbi:MULTISPECIES: hypothetical protein [unclassified Kaistella]|uniref:hypothetical protein n=1 Tax=unclassified Kaistella TaxID=2762626 RepID=UPI002734526C|nr:MULTISPECIES: hypothetical protein [unclassified Kaistella]MCZ2085030.1 hypothetical protein [Flavobacteriales bacterium]MDP2453687.1 hypothetical protein [Kaistella sp. SH11-4b]MDP2456744.1 hypothetical protein [Kaistella sp. SH40-3]MDP2459500.1 hypothetical protein [Kaistella sp. SH19-2b]